MAITYDEIEGSPSIVMDRDGGSARRTFKIAWADIGRAILEVFPGALFGYPYTASIPGFPWLRAQKMSIDPFDPNNPTGTGQRMNTYPGGAKVVVDYAPNKWPDSDMKDGPDEGELQDITFLEQKVNFGGEYLTWPNNGVRWEKDTDGETTYSTGGGGNGVGEKKFQVIEDINVGIVIPTIEHTMTWKFVAFPPWQGIRNCLGKVNSVAHMNCQPETLLFNGCTAERTYSTQGSPTWSLEYRISEKCYNYPLQVERGLSGPIITAGGTGYSVGDRLSFKGGIGKSAVVTVTTVNAITGAVTGVAIASRGRYTTIPTRPNAVFSETGSGSGCSISDGFNWRSLQSAQGWNHFLRPNTGRFERMVRKDGSGVYGAANFRQLYGGRA